METRTLRQGGERKEHHMQPGRGQERRSGHGPALEGDVALCFAVSSGTFISEGGVYESRKQCQKVSHMPIVPLGKQSPAQRGNPREQLLMKKQNWKSQTKMKELAKGHHGKVWGRGKRFQTSVHLTAALLKKATTPQVPWLLRK